MNIKPFQSKAMTISEVLVTLLVIGIVAAMTIPTLITQKAKEETAKGYQRMYSILTQAVLSSRQDNGEFSNWNWGDSITVRESFDTYWAPYLRISKYCTTYQDCGYQELAPWYNYNGTASTTMGCVNTNRTSVILNDGTFLMVRYKSGVPSIHIDLNGGKKPNREGKDYFRFAWSNTKGIEADPDYGSKIQQNGWAIPSNYAW